MRPIYIAFTTVLALHRLDLPRNACWCLLALWQALALWRDHLKVRLSSQIKGSWVWTEVAVKALRVVFTAAALEHSKRKHYDFARTIWQLGLLIPMCRRLHFCIWLYCCCCCC